MRKMISGADQEALKRLKNNIVVNESGTRIEVGGNVAFEDISAIGVKGENTDTGFKIYPNQLNVEDYSVPQKIATGITTAPFTSYDTEQNISGVEYQDGDMYALQQSSDVVLFEVKIGDTYYINFIPTDSSSTAINIANGTLARTLSGLVANPPEEVFVPFMQIVEHGVEPPVAPAGFMYCWVSEGEFGFCVSDGKQWFTIGEI